MKMFLSIMIVIVLLASTRDLMSLVLVEDYLVKLGNREKVSTLLIIAVELLGILFALKCDILPFRKALVIFSVGMLLHFLLILLFPFIVIARTVGNLILIISAVLALSDLLLKEM